MEILHRCPRRSWLLYPQLTFIQAHPVRITKYPVALEVRRPSHLNRILLHGDPTSGLLSLIHRHRFSMPTPQQANVHGTSPRTSLYCHLVVKANGGSCTTRAETFRITITTRPSKRRGKNLRVPSLYPSEPFKTVPWASVFPLYTSSRTSNLGRVIEDPGPSPLNSSRTRLLMLSHICLVH